MPGLCGWIEGQTGGNPDLRLRGLANGLFRRPGEDLLLWRNDWAALAVLSKGAAALHANDHTAVALTGRPYWDDSVLEKLAAESGFAASIAHAFLERGDAFLNALKGAFSLAIIDLVRRSALVAIDRVGVETICFADFPEGGVFASRADAIKAHPSIDAAVTAQGIYRYAMNYVSPAPRTVYRSIDKLLPGHAARKALGSSGPFHVERYWAPSYQPVASPDAADMARALMERLDVGVRRAVAGASDVGAFLSGGLDSSTVCGLLARQLDGKAPAYTIIFEDERYNEGPYARLAAQHFNLAHREYCLQPQDVVDILPAVVRLFDEPFGNSSVMPAYFCAHMAKEDVGLILAGDGGDELFAGNKRYVEQRILSYYHSIPSPLRRAGEILIAALPPALDFGIIGKIQRYSRRARLPMPERLHNPSVYSRGALGQVFTQEFLAALDIEEPYALWSRHYLESGTDDMLASMLHMDMRITIADNDIRKVSGACMLADIDVAYPMLDDDLIGFAASVPSELLLKGGRLRDFYKQSMKGFLPDAILNKGKHGFGMPFSEWTRSHPPLREISVDCLETLGRRGMFRADFLDDVLTAHIQEAPAATDGIVWDLVMLELWLRDRSPSMA